MPIQPTDNKLSYVCILSRERRLAGGRRKAAVTYWSAWWSCRPGLTRWPWVTLNICKHTHTHKECTGYSWNINVQFSITTIKYFFRK